MLRVGLTGGIGSGKSTVSRHLAGLGAVVVDADQLARAVLEPGTPGLAAVVERFGTQVLAPDGALDRPALGRVVFADPSALHDLEAITHPGIGALAEQRLADVDRARIGVYDMPLLVEKGLGPAYHLVLVVGADADVRVDRLVRTRGMAPEDASARIAAQATDEQRRAAADVWVDNNGTPETLQLAVDALWHERLAPYDENLRHGIRVRRTTLSLAAPDPTWPAQGARLSARLRHLLRDRALTVDHIGSTSVPGLVAKDVIDLQVGVASMGAADDPDLVRTLADGGFPRVDGITVDRPKDGSAGWPKRVHGGSDPGRLVNVHLREAGGPAWTWALRFRDWLRDDAAARRDYVLLKTRLAADLTDIDAYAEAKEPWFDTAGARASEWARATGWQPYS